jgi:hypothetical protein
MAGNKNLLCTLSTAFHLGLVFEGEHFNGNNCRFIELTQPEMVVCAKVRGGIARLQRKSG